MVESFHSIAAPEAQRLCTSANDLHFHVFLLEGVARSNLVREVVGVREANSDPIYNSALTSAVNNLSENVLGKKLLLFFHP